MDSNKRIFATAKINSDPESSTHFFRSEGEKELLCQNQDGEEKSFKLDRIFWDDVDVDGVNQTSNDELFAGSNFLRKL